MKKTLIIAVLLAGFLLFLLVSGCDKERIVESTEYIHDIEYVESPPDTVFMIDTVYNHDSTTVNTTDTVLIIDTVTQVTYIHDTVTVIENHYDTIQVTQYSPNEYLAIAALQYYTDPMVIDFIYDEFGYDDGWVFYLSSFQLDLTRQSSGVYDIYGYIDYWTPDWSGYYPLEFYWRMVYTGGDPADPDNWDLTDPPSSVAVHTPGIKLTTGNTAANRNLH
nr:hypothetical protein [candidate division Zixibacteria bacterium]